MQSTPPILLYSTTRRLHPVWRVLHHHPQTLSSSDSTFGLLPNSLSRFADKVTDSTTAAIAKNLVASAPPPPPPHVAQRRGKQSKSVDWICVLLILLLASWLSSPYFSRTVPAVVPLLLLSVVKDRRKQAAKSKKMC